MLGPASAPIVRIWRRPFSTGIQVQTNIDTLPQVRARSYCPHCEAEHVWWTNDAILVDVIPPSEWVENQEKSSFRQQRNSA
jgi:hypothetical protein